MFYWYFLFGFSDRIRIDQFSNYESGTDLTDPDLTKTQPDPNPQPWSRVPFWTVQEVLLTKRGKSTHE